MTRPHPRPSLILNTVLDMVFRTALVFAAFLLFAGHNAPGGGFVAGLVTGVALVLRYVAGGADEVDRVARVHETTVLGSGLFLAAGTGIAGWFTGGSFLHASKVEIDLPLLGTLKATSALLFDLGVYLIVVGLTLSLLRSLGAAADQDFQHALQHPERGDGS